MLTVLMLAGSGCCFLKQKELDSTAIPNSGEESVSAKHTGELLSGGEADPARMTLTMKAWTWTRTQYNNDTVIIPVKADAFTLTFNNDGRLNATTDCNRMMGSYTAEGSKLSFNQLASTRMYCPDSQEKKFVDMLSQVSSFFFTPRGELVLEFKFDSGQILFK